MGRISSAGFLLIATTLAGCAGGQSLSGSDASNVSGADIAMPGRWMLAAPNAPLCGMNFAALPGKNEGAVSPEGGCPERFFTSRRWTRRDGELTIIDDKNDPLATLTFANGQFAGKSTSDTPVTLTR